MALQPAHRRLVVVIIIVVVIINLLKHTAFRTTVIMKFVNKTGKRGRSFNFYRATRIHSAAVYVRLFDARQCCIETAEDITTKSTMHDSVDTGVLCCQSY